MRFFRVVKFLVAFNIITQTIPASSCVTEEESEEPGKSFVTTQARPSSWSLSSLLHSFQRTVTSKFLPHRSSSNVPSPSKEFERQWRNIVDYVVRDSVKTAQALGGAVQFRENEYTHNWKNCELQSLEKKERKYALRDKSLRKESKKVTTRAPLSQYLYAVSTVDPNHTEENILPLLRIYLKEFYSKIGQTSLKEDHEDGELFQKGSYLADCLWDIGKLEKRQENLPQLKEMALKTYKQIEKANFDLVADELQALGILPPPTKRSRFARWGTGGLFLVLMASSSMIQSSEAQRATGIANTCSREYMQCGSGFTLFDFFKSDPGINDILSNTYFMNATQSLLMPNRLTALNTTFSAMNNIQATTSWYAEVDQFSIAGPIPTGDVTTVFYVLPAPFPGDNIQRINDTSYNLYPFDLFNIAGPEQFSVNYTFSSSGNYYYTEQFPNSEIWVFSVMLNETFGLGTAVFRPSLGTPSIYWQRVMEGTTSTHTADGVTLLGTQLNTVKPAIAALEDNNTIFNTAALYSGKVGQPNCQGNQTIAQYLASQPPLISTVSSELSECLLQPGLHPLSCFSFTTGPVADPYIRLSFSFRENTNGVQTYTKRISDGPNYSTCTYQSVSALQTQRTCNNYQWALNFKNITTTTQNISQAFNTLYGSLQQGEVLRTLELFFSGSPPSTEGIVIQTLQNATGFSGPNYFAYCSAATGGGDGSSSSSSSSGATIGAAIGGALGGAAVLGSVTATGAIIGAKFYRDRHKRKAFLEEDDTEMGLRSGVPLDAFTAKGEGIEAGRIIIKGALHGYEYLLLNKVDPREAEWLRRVGLDIEFNDGEEEKEVLLGKGAFGRVFPAQRQDNGQIDAMKVVIGTENVKSSFREGRLQSLFGEVEGVLPLLEYLHFKPTPDNKRQMKQLLTDSFGSHMNGEVDMTEQEVLLQVTPLAALGNGGTFRKNIARLLAKHLIDQEIIDELNDIFALGVSTGLSNMHDNGVSHMDIKPENVLLGRNGDIFVSDMGCAVRKNNVQGGLGDFRYFPPDRLDYCRGVVESKGYKCEKGERKDFFSGQAADAFAAGVTFLEMIHEYPFDADHKIIDMLNKRNAEYFEERLEEAYKTIREDLEILPVIKGLLVTNPKKRMKTRAARERLKTLVQQHKHSPKELFSIYREALAKAKLGDDDSSEDESSFTDSDAGYGQAATGNGQEIAKLYSQLQEVYTGDEDHVYSSIEEPTGKPSGAKLGSDKKGKGKNKKNRYAPTSEPVYQEPTLNDAYTDGADIFRNDNRGNDSLAEPTYSLPEHLRPESNDNNSSTTGVYTDGKQFL